MGQRYRIRMVVLSSGERLPVLLDQAGIPLFHPTVYSLISLRARNMAANTMESSLRAIMVFYLYLDKREINLMERLQQGELLSMAEIEGLVRFCRLTLERISFLCEESEADVPLSYVVSLEKQRKRMVSAAVKEVLPSSAANRLRTIRNFLDWLSLGFSSRHSLQKDYRKSIEVAREMIRTAIDARIPSVDGRGQLDHREGLNPKIRTKLMQVVEPESEDNPWMETHSRYRNALILNWLYYLGLRRGELLGIRIPNIDFRASTVEVTRRADDPKDPRRNQPNAKTKARKISLSSGLRDMTKDYIMSHRAVFPAAKKHDFLFVSSDTGAPMSIPSLNKIFRVLCTKHPELPRLYPHILRHTWNDIYSEHADKGNMSEETEKKTRSYLMGWSETSGTAATYTRRHIREKANKISLEMQEKITGVVKHDE